MNGKRLFAPVPHEERCKQQYAEQDRAELKRYTESVGEIVRHERTEYADEYDCKPVEHRNVFLRTHLEKQHSCKCDSHDNRRRNKTESHVHIDEVGECLADRCAQNLDNPEENCHFRNFAEKILVFSFYIIHTE